MMELDIFFLCVIIIGLLFLGLLNTLAVIALIYVVCYQRGVGCSGFGQTLRSVPIPKQPDGELPWTQDTTTWRQVSTTTQTLAEETEALPREPWLREKPELNNDWTEDKDIEDDTMLFCEENTDYRDGEFEMGSTDEDLELKALDNMKLVQHIDELKEDKLGELRPDHEELSENRRLYKKEMAEITRLKQEQEMDNGTENDLTHDDSPMLEWTKRNDNEFDEEQIKNVDGMPHQQKFRGEVYTTNRYYCNCSKSACNCNSDMRNPVTRLRARFSRNHQVSSQVWGKVSLPVGMTRVVEDEFPLQEYKLYWNQPIHSPRDVIQSVTATNAGNELPVNVEAATGDNVDELRNADDTDEHELEQRDPTTSETSSTIDIIKSEQSVAAVTAVSTENEEDAVAIYSAPLETIGDPKAGGTELTTDSGNCVKVDVNQDSDLSLCCIDKISPQEQLLAFDDGGSSMDISTLETELSMINDDSVDSVVNGVSVSDNYSDLSKHTMDCRNDVTFDEDDWNSLDQNSLTDEWDLCLDAEDQCSEAEDQCSVAEDQCSVAEDQCRVAWGHAPDYTCQDTEEGMLLDETDLCVDAEPIPDVQTRAADVAVADRTSIFKEFMSMDMYAANGHATSTPATSLRLSHDQNDTDHIIMLVGDNNSLSFSDDGYGSMEQSSLSDTEDDKAVSEGNGIEEDGDEIGEENNKPGEENYQFASVGNNQFPEKTYCKMGDEKMVSEIGEDVAEKVDAHIGLRSMNRHIREHDSLEHDVNDQDGGYDSFTSIDIDCKEVNDDDTDSVPIQYEPTSGHGAQLPPHKPVSAQDLSLPSLHVHQCTHHQLVHGALLANVSVKNFTENVKFKECHSQEHDRRAKKKCPPDNVFIKADANHGYQTRPGEFKQSIKFLVSQAQANNTLSTTMEDFDKRVTIHAHEYLHVRRDAGSLSIDKVDKKNGTRVVEFYQLVENHTPVQAYGGSNNLTSAFDQRLCLDVYLNGRPSTVVQIGKDNMTTSRLNT